MRDFPRMVDEGADEFEAGLLRSADRDAGDERALARTLAAMGVAVLASTALRAAGSAAAQGPAPGLSAGQALEAGQGTAQANGSAALSGGAGGSAPLAGASGIRSFASSSVASGVAGLIIGIVLALGVPMVADGAGGQPASVLVASRMPHLRGVDAEVVAPPAPEPAPPPAEVIGPELPARRPEPAPTSPAASGKATSPDGASGRSEVSLGASPEATTSPATPQVMVGVRGVSLSEEVKMLDRARAALVGGDSSRALRALDTYDAACPGGALAPEAKALRVEALAASGDRRRAKELAEPMLREASPHQRRLRRVLGGR